ncbi:hypothetical protein F5Y16DRAFT_363678 [Xylariaceae sp. FL0255]|nr:hypothetical protein F5Y16DRAFT_363678 [Xylariaceae sp. FL0255]
MSFVLQNFLLFFSSFCIKWKEGIYHQSYDASIIFWHIAECLMSFLCITTTYLHPTSYLLVNNYYLLDLPIQLTS